MTSSKCYVRLTKDIMNFVIQPLENSHLFGLGRSMLTDMNE